METLAAPALTEAQLDTERRALLGDQRTPDQLPGPQLQRFVEVCGLLRALKRARGEVADRPGRAKRSTLDITDL